MTTNRLKKYTKDVPNKVVPEQKAKTVISQETDTKIWSVWYKERNKFQYITNLQLKDLLDIGRVKITGSYEVVDFDGLKKKVWVDGVITPSSEELAKFEELNAPKDFFDKEIEEDDDNMVG